jgi:polyvinyl alcohol dehydrogenase (cytochrome)
MTGTRVWKPLAIAIFVAILTTAALQIRAEESEEHASWTMAGHDISDTRNQPSESIIGARNVARLAPKWILTTFGDVSATPAVVGDDDDRDHGDDHGRQAVYFPDWGGKLWKVDARTGTVLWMHSISDYNGIPGSVSRTSPVVSGGMVYIGDLNGNMIAIDAATGDQRWIAPRTTLDPNPAATVTASPIIHGNRLYANFSSTESAYARTHPGYVCCTFRGSMIALDARTGELLWKSYVLPDNNGQPDRFSGGAFVNPPAIDIREGLVYGGAGNLYTLPAGVASCLGAAPNGWNEACFPSEARFNSVVAFDLRTGQPRWSFRGSGADARQLGCGTPAPSWCPPTASVWPLPNASLFSVWDFAGSGANVFRARINGRNRDVVGIGQKSGIYWALDAATGEFLWSRLVGPGSDPGGIQWGTAYDGKQIYAAIGHTTHQAYALPSGQVITGGSWAALNPSTGHILWQTPDPQGAPDQGALTVANGVLYGASIAKTGDMYALDIATGAILWTFASGGSVVEGPAVVNGTVYWGSGYARAPGGKSNNQFYAFSIDGR